MASLEIVGKDGQRLALLNETTGEELLTEAGVRRMTKSAKKGSRKGGTYPKPGAGKPK